MKLDFNAVWDQALKLVSANLDVVAALAGVFFFFPSLAYGLFIPAITPPGGGDMQTIDFKAFMSGLEDFYAQYWWAIALLSVVQATGSIAMLALIGDRARPTVGAALRRGVTFLPTQIGAQLIAAIAAVALPSLIVGIALASGSSGITLLTVLVAVPIIIYLLVKLSLTSAVIAIEKELNPLTALLRSWRLTKGNSLRLFLFYLLLGIAYFVVSTVVSLVVRLIMGLFGDTAFLIGMTVLSAANVAVAGVIANAVFAAVRSQFVSSGSASAANSAD